MPNPTLDDMVAEILDKVRTIAGTTPDAIFQQRMQSVSTEVAMRVMQAGGANSAAHFEDGRWVFAANFPDTGFHIFKISEYKLASLDLVGIDEIALFVFGQLRGL